jgi:hypothetical protein
MLNFLKRRKSTKLPQITFVVLILTLGIAWINLYINFYGFLEVFFFFALLLSSPLSLILGIKGFRQTKQGDERELIYIFAIMVGLATLLLFFVLPLFFFDINLAPY